MRINRRPSGLPFPRRLPEVTIAANVMAEVQTSPTALVRLRQLPERLAGHKDFARLVQALHMGASASADGVWGSSCALLAAVLAQQAPATLVVVCPQLDQLDHLADDLALFSTLPCERLPAWESEPTEHLIHDEIYGQRLRTLKALVQSPPPDVVLTSIQSLLQPVPSRQSVADHTRHIRLDQTVDGEQLKRWLATHRFHPTSAVELPGEFSARGGIIDIFAPDWNDPVRVELFGDQVESIRRFDVASQRSLDTLDAVEVTLVRPGRDDRDHLADYLPPQSWLLLIEPEQCQAEGTAYLQRLEHPEAFHRVAATMRRIGEFATLTAASLAAGSEATAVRLPIESVERFSGEFNRVRDELSAAGQEHDVILVGQTEAEVERLDEIFGDMPLARDGRLHLAVGHLNSGFRLTDEQVLLVSGGELFHRADLPRPIRRHLGKAIDTFLDLREGDLVVHLAHGIGRYRGLKLLTREDQVEEHLAIEFGGGTRVFVPASKIDLVQKYVGGTKRRPTLAKIGGKAWVRQKEAAKAAVTDLAAEMLELQAARRSRPGIAFGDDTDWQREFDASFPYVETDDQVVTIRSMKDDMHAARPMDRLLCGDVGFGKTELAIRAAFKAVDNGFQVGVLVPTTILAEQHHRTFRERMAEFPFDIAKLSRFCTAREQRETIERLKRGQIDIVIGTHRLASRDVGFANLGLLIIDEEQRFGVDVKERLKRIRATVDVLTMTATPIPRTLHMSLVGLRDISNLNTPPEDRMAVETRVTRWEDRAIRHAVMREMNRGGQVFFVHNRVQELPAVARRLQHIVPEARTAVAHGQMPEGQLEQVMVEFVAGEYDLLLATTIVESGLDIPNANTIFINDADRYGLADLHQLRGRVGRYKHRAYCYLLIDPRKSITPNAARRLRAIEEFSELGAGFSIAMRDLEIRGAGNILGTEQSGHIAVVGYELYCQLLESAVRALKRLPPKLSVETDIDLPVEAFIPRQYVPDMRLKIDLYRRLCRVSSEQELNDFRAELLDRFGSPPPPVERMLELAELKIEASVWQIDVIRREGRYLVLEYADRSRAEQLVRSTGRRLRLADDRSLYLPLAKEVTDGRQMMKTVKSVLRCS